MIESKLITLLRTLSKEEIRRFGKFLEGTAERKVLDRMAFFDYLEKYHPEFSEKKVKREVVAQKLFPKNDNRLKKVENLMHKMVLVLEDFMVYEELKMQQTQRDFLLLESYKRRKLDKFFFKKIDKIEQEWELKKPEGIEQLHNEYLIKKICFEHPNYHNISNEASIITQDNLIHQIDKYYFVVKLYRTLCAYTNSHFVNNSNENTEQKQLFIREILSLSRQADYHNISQIKLLGNLYAAYTTGNFEYYNDIVEEFIFSLNLYNEYEKMGILALLTNICYEMHRREGGEAINKLFKLNQLAVEHKLILANGYITNTDFRNIVYIACAARELDWAEEFVANYSRFLHPNFSNDVVLCESIIDFNRGNYNKALNKLITAKFQDVFYSAQARTIMLQCYYELNSELFHSTADSFKGFLNRNTTLSASVKKAFSNFIRFVKKLEKAKHEFRPDIEHLATEIAKTSEVVNRSWLVSKLELLKPTIFVLLHESIAKMSLVAIYR